MRKKIVSGCFLAIGVLLILGLLNLNRLVQRHKTYLLAQAEQSLGRKIAAERIEVTLWPVSARLVDVTVSDAPALSTEPLLRTKAMQVELHFWPLLIGQFRSRKVALDSPVFTIARNNNSSYRTDGVPRVKKRNRKAEEDLTRQPPTEKQDSPPIIIVAPLKISDGTLHYRDLESGRELTVTQINLRIDGSEPDQPFDVELEAAVMTAKTNLKLKGSFGPMAGIRDYRDIPIDGNIQVDALDMGKVNSAMPQLKKGLPRVLQFDGVYTTKDLKFKGSLNNLSLKGAITGSDASLRFE